MAHGLYLGNPAASAVVQPQSEEARTVSAVERSGNATLLYVHLGLAEVEVGFVFVYLCI